MTIAEIRDLLANRIANLSQQRSHAAAIGDIARVAALDTEIEETRATLAQLESLA